MKPLHNFIVSAVALAGLLGATASHAVDVAQLPLKASVLAKPNVIFGMDDSGSMDWEVLLDTSSGLLWWNGTTAWDTGTGKPLAYNGSYYAYAYLLPVGTATGGQLYAYNSSYGLALPPTNQFAWLRSPTFNPLYYNTNITYPHWSPAYQGGAPRTYPDATPSAAKSHPIVAAAPTLDVGTNWTSAAGNFNTNGYRFYVQAGMVVPAGARVKSSATDATGAACTDVERTLTADQTVGAGRACWASIPYYPATFWHAEACTLGADCVNRPDGAGTLRRYEIKSGNTFPSSRSHAAELQNFANWFTYYRKRKLMLAASMGKVMEDISGLRMGVVPFNNHATVTMYDAESTTASQNPLAVAGLFYGNAMSPLGTPTHATMKHIGSQYDTNKNIIEFACQRNSSFIVTDGFSNTASITPPAWDAGKSAATWGAAAPHATTHDGTQADVALRQFTNRLRSSDLKAGLVPKSAAEGPNADTNTDLHINTYGITLGVRGSIWPAITDAFATPPAWPVPLADDPSLIDDLWHATINGRGQMYLASSPEETAASIQAGLDDIRSQTGAQGGIAVSTVNLSRGDERAYFGTYDPAGWVGDLEAYPIDKATGHVSTGAANRQWSASALLTARDWTTRVIASFSGGAGVEFTATNVAGVVNPGAVYGSDGDVMDYLRGKRDLEGTAFRKRLGLIGAVIGSEPAVDRDAKVAYVQSGEGMLHAIDVDKAGTTGKELWAYVPGAVLPKIGATVKRGYVFRSVLDGSPVIGTLGVDNKLLVAGLGVAGNSYHAIDVSSPRGLTQAGLAGKVKWEFPSAADAPKMGLALGRPVIVKTENDGHVVLLTSGYNTGDGKGRLWMVSPTDGTVLHEFEVPTDGLAQVSPFGQVDGTVKYVYGGDLSGNVWRFDLTGKGAAFKLATLKDALGNAQPVTAAPELAMIEGRRVIIVGTGRLLDISDFGSSGVQSMYVMADDGALLANARTVLTQQFYTHAGAVTVTDIDWTAAATKGWFLDLAAGEQINTRPSLAFGTLAWVANIAGKADCSAKAYLYLANVVNGDAIPGIDYSWLISDKANSSGVTLLRTTDGMVPTGQTFDGEPWAAPPIPFKNIPASKNAWRDIRR